MVLHRTSPLRSPATTRFRPASPGDPTLQWLVSYTFAKSIDNASGAGGGAGLAGVLNTGAVGDTGGILGNQLDNRANRGVSDFDRTHRMVLSFAAPTPLEVVESSSPNWNPRTVCQVDEKTPCTLMWSIPSESSASQRALTCIIASYLRPVARRAVVWDPVALRSASSRSNKSMKHRMCG